MSNTNRIRISVITRVAVLAALSAVLYIFPEIPTLVPFYKIDLSNIPALLGAFSISPAAGAVILFIKDLTGMLHTTSAYVGELADLVTGLAMVLPAALIYRGNKCRKRALLGMLVGALSASVAGAFMNYYVLIPFFISSSPYITMEAVIESGAVILPFVKTLEQFIIGITVPFNVIKFVLLSLVTYFIYKPLSPLLHSGKRQQAEPEPAQK
ncbi:MAG: ECF transporter S component [Eubacteriales bacterium]|nr:ECF transporter S component [Eubacteriales bacterium]